MSENMDYEEDLQDSVETPSTIGEHLALGGKKTSSAFVAEALRIEMMRLTVLIGNHAVDLAAVSGFIHGHGVGIGGKGSGLAEPGSTGILIIPLVCIILTLCSNINLRSFSVKIYTDCRLLVDIRKIALHIPFCLSKISIFISQVDNVFI